jgi:hypothetical protein
MNGRSAREVVEELLRRQQASEDLVLDDLVAEDMINHAAGPQGRSGLARILSNVDHDLGPVTVEHADIQAVHTYEGTDSIQSLIVGRAITGISAFV